jgi:hypothetical protein
LTESLALVGELATVPTFRSDERKALPRRLQSWRVMGTPMRPVGTVIEDSRCEMLTAVLLMTGTAQGRRGAAGPEQVAPERKAPASSGQGSAYFADGQIGEAGAPDDEARLNG